MYPRYHSCFHGNYPMNAHFSSINETPCNGRNPPPLINGKNRFQPAVLGGDRLILSHKRLLSPIGSALTTPKTQTLWGIHDSAVLVNASKIFYT